MNDNLAKNIITVSVLILILTCKWIHCYIDEDDVVRGSETDEFAAGRNEATEHASQAPCSFDNVDGGRICNCGYRSEVNDLKRNSFPRKCDMAVIIIIGFIKKLIEKNFCYFPTKYSLKLHFELLQPVIKSTKPMRHS